MPAKSIFLSVLGFVLLLVSALPAWTLGRETDDEILRNFLWEKFTQLPKNKRPQIGVALSAGGKCAPTACWGKAMNIWVI